MKISSHNRIKNTLTVGFVHDQKCLNLNNVTNINVIYYCEKIDVTTTFAIIYTFTARRAQVYIHCSMYMQVTNSVRSEC